MKFLTCYLTYGLVVLGILHSNLIQAQADGHTLLEHFWQPLDGEVRAVEVDADKRILYFGGSFTAIGPGSATAGLVHAPSGYTAAEGSMNTHDDKSLYGYSEASMDESLPRNNLAAIDLDTGLPIDWAPVPDGEVYAISVGANGIYVGGNFAEVNDEVRTYLAAFDREDGSLLPFAAALEGTGMNAGVRALVYDNNQLIAGGNFSTTGPNARHKLVAFDSNTGAVNNWPESPLGFTPVHASVNVLTQHGDLLYIGGDFNGINGAPRPCMARLALGDASLDAWNPIVDLVEPSVEIDFINSIVVHNDEVLCAGRISGSYPDCVYSVAKIDANSGALIPWGVSGLPIDCILLENVDKLVYYVAYGNAMAIAGDVLYSAGEGFFRENNVNSGSFVPDYWQPDLSWTDEIYIDEGIVWPINYSAYALTLWGNKLIIGGNFESFGTAARSRLAVVELPCNVEAGTLLEPEVISYCSGTGVEQSVNLQVEGATGPLQRWGLLNSQDQIIANRVGNSKFNLDALDAGDYRIGFMKYTEDVSLAGIAMLHQIEDLQGCIDYTTLVDILVREKPLGGTISTSVAGDICSQASQVHPVQVNGNTGSGSIFGIIDLDNNNQIVASFENDFFDTGSLEAGNYKIYHLAYQDGVELSSVEFPSDLNGCFSLSPGLAFSVVACSDIQVHTYPNPASYHGWVTYSMPASGYSQVSLYDLQGRLVKAFATQYSAADVVYRLEINTGQLVNGVYVLRVSTDYGVQSEKMVVNH